MSLTSSDGLTLFAHFDDIGGLTDRSPVRLAGVTVGRVTQIDLDEALEVVRGETLHRVRRASHLGYAQADRYFRDVG